MNNKRAIFFDLDGTLIDSKPIIFDTLNYTLRQLGEPEVSLDDVGAIIGHPLSYVLSKFIKDKSEESVAAATDIFRAKTRSGNLANSKPYPKVAETLAGLANHRKLFVVTNRMADTSRSILDVLGFSKYFVQVYGTSILGEPKEKTDSIKKVFANHLNLDPKNIIMVGDRNHDMIAGKNNGLKTIGVSYGYGSKDELLISGADQVIDCISELSKLVHDQI